MRRGNGDQEQHTCSALEFALLLDDLDTCGAWGHLTRFASRKIFLVAGQWMGCEGWHLAGNYCILTGTDGAQTMSPRAGLERRGDVKTTEKVAPTRLCASVDLGNKEAPEVNVILASQFGPRGKRLCRQGTI